MKQSKKPTLAQKKLMAKAGLIWKNWNVVYEDAVSIDIVSKKSGQRRSLAK